MKRLLALLLLFPLGLHAQPTTDATVTIGFAAEATTLDPIKYSAGADSYGMSQMFEQLVRQIPPDWKQAAWLAESWAIAGTPDRPVIDVQLRPGVTFHNGDPLTADDFLYAYTLQRDPKESHFPHLWTAVERFEIVDPLHFRLHLSSPDGTFVVDNLRLWAVPRRYAESVGRAGFGQAPVGTGPWKFVSRRIKEELVLEAFDGYWNQAQRPRIRRLVIKTIPEDLTRAAAFRTGAVDLIDAVPVAMLGDIAAMPGVRTATLNTGNNVYINFATHLPNSPFNDIRVRQAAAHAIDLDAIIAKVLFKQGERYVELGVGTFGYDPALKPLPYDPRRARALLAEAGFSKGFEVPCYNMTTPREPNIKEFGEAVFAYLGAVGIKCRIRGLEYNAWLRTVRRNTDPNFQMEGVILAMYGHGIPGDPATAWAQTLHSYSGDGWGASAYGNDREIDALIEAQRAELDVGKREAMVRQIAHLKHDRLAGGLSLYRPLQTFAWRDRLDFKPWANPGIWHQMQEIAIRK